MTTDKATAMIAKKSHYFDMELACVEFIRKSPFFAEISRRITKINSKNCSTAAVSWNKELDSIVMFWNTEFFSGLTPRQREGVITHELLHVVLGHISIRHRKPSKLWNVATDCAINSIIETTAGMKQGEEWSEARSGLPQVGLVPGRPLFILKKDANGEKQISRLTSEDYAKNPIYACIEKMPMGLSSEDYFSAFMDLGTQEDDCQTCGGSGKVKKQKSSGGQGNDPGEGESGGDKGESGESGDKPGGKSGSGGDEEDENVFEPAGEKHSHADCDEYDSCPDCGGHGDGDIETLDDHTDWDNVSEDVREYINNRVRGIIEAAAAVADSRSDGWGNVPAGVIEQIRKMLSRKVEWREVLRQFVGSMNSGDRTTSIKRINRRYPYVHPGMKRGRMPKLLIAIDQSGSVSTEMLTVFFAELAGLTTIVDVEIIHFDCTLDERTIYTWERGSTIDLKRTRSGGTDFDAPTRLVNDVKHAGRWDGMLILTDGECCAPQACKIKRGWVLGPGHKLMFQSDETQVHLENPKK